MDIGRKFDTKVQHLKYKALREVARRAWAGNLYESLLDLPYEIIPGKTPTIRCCVYKERAIVAERIKLAMGGDKEHKNVIQVIPIACDECPIGGYEVSNACRGCLAHRCAEACPKDAISFRNSHEAVIDKSLCINCGACAKVCPYTAIINHIRPCERSCKVKAISMDEDKNAHIDDDKCIACGACVYQCPFGAISDRSFILDAIDLIKKSEGNTNYRVYAVVAPAISSQFTYAKLGQVISGLKEMGFYSVTEAALGADMVAFEESEELSQKGLLTSSCCPAFVRYVKLYHPEMSSNVSTTLSPMARIGKHIKENDENARVVFIGPCTAKKMEIKEPEPGRWVDVALTFEELQALFDSRDIDITQLEPDELYDASEFGRIFARCGGLADAVREGLKEHNEDFELKAMSCNGIEECRLAMLKLQKGLLDANFIEGMACMGGCVDGAGCLSHSPKNRAAVDRYGKAAHLKSIEESVNAADEIFE